MLCTLGWIVFDILSAYNPDRDMHPFEMEQEEIVAPCTPKDIDKIYNEAASTHQSEFIDSPVRLLPADKDGNMQDSIKNLLIKILEYYEQSATGQQAKA